MTFFLALIICFSWMVDVVCFVLCLCLGCEPVSLRVMKPEATSCNVMLCHVLGKLSATQKTDF